MTETLPTPAALCLTSGEIIFDPKMRRVATMEAQYQALSPEIVRRYNAHEALLKAARLMRTCIRQEPNQFVKGWGEEGELTEVVDTIKMREAYEAAVAAIAAWEGR